MRGARCSRGCCRVVLRPASLRADLPGRDCDASRSFSLKCSSVSKRLSILARGPLRFHRSKPPPRQSPADTDVAQVGRRGWGCRRNCRLMDLVRQTFVAKALPRQNCSSGSTVASSSHFEVRRAQRNVTTALRTPQTVAIGAYPVRVQRPVKLRVERRPRSFASAYVYPRVAQAAPIFRIARRALVSPTRRCGREESPVEVAVGVAVSSVVY